MKLIWNVEINKNISSKYVYVYKIEQISTKNRKIDIRDIVGSVFQKLYSNVIAGKLDILFCSKEILMDNLFKIFIFILGKDEEVQKLMNSMLEKEPSIFHVEKYPLANNLDFLKNYIYHLAITHISCYFKFTLNLKAIDNFFLINKINIFDELNEYYTFFSFVKNDYDNDNIKKYNDIIYIKLNITVQFGLLKIRNCHNKNTIKTLSKIQLNTLFNKKYLSELKVVCNDKKTIFNITDDISKQKLELKEYSHDILLSYPVYLINKSKVYYPFIIDYLARATDSYNNELLNENIILTSFYINIITLESSDQQYFSERISLIPDDENLKIYENIHYLDDKYLNKTYLPFILIYSDYLNSSKLKFTYFQDFIFSSFYLILNKHENLNIFGEIHNSITIYDDYFKYEFELALLEFFAFIIQYNKNKKSEILDESNIADISNDDYTLNESFCNNSSFRKSLLKPYNKDDILLREECEVDYGDKKITRKDLKNREEYVRKIISEANKEVFTKMEGEIVNGVYKEKHKKITFCIPNDTSLIISKLSENN